MENLLELANQITELLPIAEYPKQAADGSAAATTAEFPIGVVGSVDNVQIPIGAITIHPGAALTANDSTFATITVSKRTAGGASVTIGSCTTQTTGQPTGTGNWVAWTPFNITLAAGAFVTPGDAITLSIAKASTGVVVPALYLSVFMKTT